MSASRSARMCCVGLLTTTAALLLCCCSPTSSRLAGPAIPSRAEAPAPYWSVTAVDSGGARTSEVGEALGRCAAGLTDHLPGPPRPIRVLTYGSRDAFVQGLQTELGFSPESAHYLQHHGSPKPIGGVMLVPPDQPGQNICHEFVHHALESFVHRDELQAEKWFEEGLATLLAQRIFDPGGERGRLGWLLSFTGGELLPLESIRSQSAWDARHRSDGGRSVAYIQAMSMAGYLLPLLGDGGLPALLKLARETSLTDALERVTDLTAEALYATWLAAQPRQERRLIDLNPNPWIETVIPAEVGLSAEALAHLVDAARESLSDALLVVKDGRLVVERYPLYHRGPIPIMSVTKSIVALAVGLLIEEKTIPSVDTPLARWLPQWRGTAREEITLAHVLTHTSGLHHARADGEMARQADRTAYAAGQPLDHPPGSRFSYNNEAAQLLSEVVAQAAGQPLDVYLDARLFRPLGITGWRWDRDRAGNVLAYTGLALRARDLARIGQLLLDGGRLHGSQLIPAAWVKRIASPQIAAKRNMGYLWWILRGDDGEVRASFGDGWLGQYLIVYPDLDMVVVRLHDAAEYSEEENRRYGFNEIFDLVDATLKPAS